MDQSSITSFSGNNHYLSNFYPSPIQARPYGLTTLPLITYPTVEHYFQAHKVRFDNSTLLHHLYAAGSGTPGQAKKYGRRVPLRGDWEDVKTSVMWDALMFKFTQHTLLYRKLAATGDAHLEEGNHWGDRFWGTVNGEGENHLGKLLMRLRTVLTTQ